MDERGRFDPRIEESMATEIKVPALGESVTEATVAKWLKKIGDRVVRGERVGLIKFGSRVDVIFPAGATVNVKVGDHVAGGSSVLAVSHASAAIANSHTVAEAR